MKKWNAEDISYATNWEPFALNLRKPDLIRGLGSVDGVIDRLRVVAFAELQARDAFRMGARKFVGKVDSSWIDHWNRFSEVENRHAQLLLDRMFELNGDLGARKVSDKLIRLCMLPEDPVLFLFLLASAEERGMESGEILKDQMAPHDAISAQLFGQIAAEEVEHVEIGKQMLLGSSFEALRERAKEVDRQVYASSN